MGLMLLGNNLVPFRWVVGIVFVFFLKQNLEVSS